MDLQGATVAVTGASGFVGHYVVRVLLQRGANVLAVLRNPTAGLAFSHKRLQIRRGDIAEASSLKQALGGADALIHSAALISVGGKAKQDLIVTNQLGTRNTFQAAAALGIGRAVLTSSVSVYRPKRGHFYRESDPLFDWSHRPGRRHWYAVTKAEAERIATAIARDATIKLAIARPQMIHGAYCRDGFSAAFTKWLRLPIAPEPRGWRFPCVYAGDLAEAMVRMLERDSAAGKTYNVANVPGAVDFPDHVNAWAAAGGQAPRWRIPLPTPVERRYSIDAAVHDLNWKNRPLVEGYREMLALLGGENPEHRPEWCDAV